MTPRGVSNSLEASTRRRSKILHYLGIGLSTSEIAAAVNLDVRTVQRHLAHHRAGRPPRKPGGRPAPETMPGRDARGWFVPN